MNKIILAIIAYLLLGIGLVLWDFRKLINDSLSKTNKQPISSMYLEPPRFLDNLTISTTLIFILIWPIKLLQKFLRF